MMMRTLLIATLAFCLQSAQADNSRTASGLDLDTIMADPDWIGARAENAFLSYDGTLVYFQRKREGELIRDWYQVPVAGGEPTELPHSPLDSATRIHNQDASRYVFIREGDVFLRDGDELTQVTRTGASEERPQFSADGTHLVFQRDATVMTYNIDSRELSEQVTFHNGEDKQFPKLKQDFLSRQQRELMQTLTDDIAQARRNRENAKASRNGDDRRSAYPIYLGKKVKRRWHVASPDLKHVLLITQPDEKGGPRTEMPNYVTEDGYTKSRDVRVKVGLNAPVGESYWLVNIADGSRTAINLEELPGVKKDPLAALRKSARAWHIERGHDEKGIEKKLKAPDVRPVRLEASPVWNQAGTHVALMLHSIDNKDRWLISIDTGGEIKVLERLTFSDGWVNYANNAYGWMDDDLVWFQSETTGFAHLYSVNATDRKRAKATPLTRGEFMVTSPTYDRRTGTFHYIANRDDPSQYRLHRHTGDDVTAVADTFATPGHVLGARPYHVGENAVLFYHSSTTAPPELALAENGNHRILTESTTTAFRAHSWVAPELIDVPSTHFDGNVRSRLYRPTGNTEGKRPAVIFVHGAGYLQNAHAGWSAYFREFMFHTLLTEHGYVVLDMDYRGSRGYGSDWRTAIYRQMGHPELEDLIDGASWLAENENVDPDRIGVYGGSYGGFMTFMALFRSPGTFAAGASLRPVTDWAHYNHGYTSNILNTPLIDPVAYEKSSPIYFTESYDNTPMLIAHGMQDGNVHFQDSVRLVQRLMELKKENFEMAIYPLDPHGFRFATSWLDEYRRIFKLFETSLSSD